GAGNPAAPYSRAIAPSPPRDRPRPARRRPAPGTCRNRKASRADGTSSQAPHAAGRRRWNHSRSGGRKGSRCSDPPRTDARSLLLLETVEIGRDAPRDRLGGAVAPARFGQIGDIGGIG